ncbi:MAG: DUF499 domain-containing protein [Blastocatellia bacterium]|nr:DUF499 domain-containing protein [Blastocatellia bacterium]
MPNNYQRLTEGFSLLTAVLAPYVCANLESKFGSSWWQTSVLDKLYDNQRQDLPKSGTEDALVGSLDAARCLILIDLHWNEIFKQRLTKDHRNWVKELLATRNKWAHKGAGDVKDDDAWRALDTMTRMMEQLDAEATERIRELAREVRYGTTGASTTAPATAPPVAEKAVAKAAGQPGGLRPWRFVAEPHPDVAEGRYRQAEFAADLSQVLRGTAQVEYQDPVEFFGRTYVTEGMRGLLGQALQRVSGKGGEPVIQLKTAFGGGKTHSMLALYHLLRGKVASDKIPNVREVKEFAGVAEIPKTNVAVLVGTALNPNKSRRPANFPGITIRTLWGEMAAQLAESSGVPEIYDIIRDSDKSSVPPGSETLVELFDTCGPCLILIDELVAYARKIYGVQGLPAGTFESVLTFVQELTEAARASQNSVVVASIPESEVEVGGEAGQRALEIIEHTFGRMEAIWKPVGAEEGFEIVRRRLFLPVRDTGARDEVCRAFSEMYRSNSSEFPSECRELAYFERLKSCYPIHPEIFDRLYNDWATIERFQKTRGVLRLMAGVIHDLWVRQDAGFMLMPGSVPLDSVTVREELTRYLSEGWNTILETDVDGQRSVPFRIDSQNPRLGQVMAARRVGRSVFLGSAPSVREQRVRGIEDIRIRLSVVQPGETVSVFNDALGKMTDQLTHLYGSNQRYWYDLQPNLRRTVEDRAQQFKPEDVEDEIERRLKLIRDRADFRAIHTCVASSDVPDEAAARLVILKLGHVHKSGQPDSSAIRAASEILNQRGTVPRNYRNMLAFIAPDQDLTDGLERETRKFLAWKSVVEDAEALNLDAHQRRQATESEKRATTTVDSQINEVFGWLLVPTQEGTGPIEWETTRIGGGTESIAAKATRKMKSGEQLILKWSPALLRMELDRWLWRDQDHLSVKKLWEYLGTYNYLPRLRDQEVLLETIRDGLRSRDYFGFATGVTEEGRYTGLSFGESTLHVYLDSASVLVKPAAAQRQIDADLAAEQARNALRAQVSTTQPVQPLTVTPVSAPVASQPATKTGLFPDPPAVSVPKEKRRYHGAVELDPMRVGRDAGRIAEEVIQHLTSLLGAKVRVTLEIEADLPNGVSESVLRTVTENCRTLKFGSHGFEED